MSEVYLSDYAIKILSPPPSMMYEEIIVTRASYADAVQIAQEEFDRYGRPVSVYSYRGGCAGTYRWYYLARAGKDIVEESRNGNAEYREYVE